MSDKNDRKRGKKVFISLIIVVIALAVAGVGYFFILRSRYQSTDDAYIDGNEAVVGALLLGRVKKLFVKEGDLVSKGTLLAELDDSLLKTRELQAEVNRMYANLCSNASYFWMGS